MEVKATSIGFRGGRRKLLPYPNKCHAVLPLSLSLDSDPRHHDRCARRRRSRPVCLPPDAHRPLAASRLRRPGLRPRAPVSARPPAAPRPPPRLLCSDLRCPGRLSLYRASASTPTAAPRTPMPRLAPVLRPPLRPPLSRPPASPTPSVP
jgi:hypothetical protein